MINKQKLYLVQIALGEYGNMEFAGDKNNPEILKYFNDKDIIPNKNTSDEESWCSVSLRWCCKKAGLPYSDSKVARDWLNIGDPTTTPELGDIVIFWRELIDSWMGHVGIFVRELDGLIYTLGGNQGNMYCIKAYLKSRVLGYRRLV